MRILIVEDEPLVVMDMENILEDLGVSIVGPAASVSKALELVEAGGFDGAFLDVNLRGERVDAVADALAAQAIPFVFTTGHGIDGLPADHHDRPMLIKPFGCQEVADVLNRHIRGKQQP
jgi:CheY-like chemotaxis protein